jgi:hypothetical protein
MSTNSLQAVQAKLGEQGVRDVKFFFDVNTTVYPSEVKEEAAVLLGKFLNGETTAFTTFNEILPA